MALLKNLMTERFTNSEFEQLPERAKQYIKHLEMCASVLKDARETALNDDKEPVARFCDLHAILAGDVCSNAIENFELRDDIERDTLANY